MKTKCMSCGGSMKKMKTGGISSNKPCGPGLCRDGQGSCVNCASAKLAGVITTGISSFFANAIKGKIRKNNKAKKKVSTAKTEAAQETVQKQKMGGATLPMMGMPMYSSNPRSEQGRVLKNGGPTNKNLKPVPEDKKNSLGKLPTAVRNKMGFQRKGGVVKKKK